jgi:Transcriptional regulator
MIDNYLLEELVTFSKYKTLAATAEHLLVTQPTVTRGMQKLEDDLDVKLFDRQPNRITLTETGKLAASEAQKVLDQNQRFYDNVRKFEFSQTKIRLGVIAPGPRMVLHSLNLADNVKIDNNFIAAETVTSKLLKNDYSLIITNQELQTDKIESRYIGTESLSVNLDQFTYLANKRSVTFQELKGLSFVVLTDIAFGKISFKIIFLMPSFFIRNKPRLLKKLRNILTSLISAPTFRNLNHKITPL